MVLKTRQFPQVRITVKLLLQNVPCPAWGELSGVGQRLRSVGLTLTPLLLCRKLELPPVSGSTEGESLHLPEPELLLMRHPAPPHKAVALLHLAFHSPSLPLSLGSPANLPLATNSTGR